LTLDIYPALFISGLGAGILSDILVYGLVAPSFQFFLTPSAYTIPNSKGNLLSGGVKYTCVKNLRFSTEIAVYLGKGTR